jgi:carbon storage regulator
MLVLTRRRGEIVCIGDDVEIQIAGERAGQFKILIKAPKSVRIDRKEVREKILAEQSPASKAS